MNVTINGQPRQLDAELPVADLLGQLGLSGKPVVVELDREPVLPGDYATTTVRDGAELEIVTIAAGG